MSLSTTQYGYIVDPMVPFTDDKGKTIKNGFIRVFMAGTSTPVITYRNYDGATNQEKIELDNSGRVMHNVIGSKGSLYKVVVYNILHSQENPLLTVDKIAVLGASINASGATIVTGLDSVTVQEENFIKATVEGTGVELALDPTEVTSEVSTIGAAETAAPDYVVPLLDKTGTGDSKKISLANLFKFAIDWISRLATTVTSFASGDFIAVSNTTNGARKMSKDTLLELTAQNALSGNVAPAFVENSTNAIAGHLYSFEGKTYVAEEDYNGSWDASKFTQTSASEFLASKLKNVVRLDFTAKLVWASLSITDGGWGGYDTWNDKRIAVNKDTPIKLNKGDILVIDPSVFEGNPFMVYYGINTNGTYTHIYWTANNVFVAENDCEVVFTINVTNAITADFVDNIQKGIYVSSSSYALQPKAPASFVEFENIDLREGTYDYYSHSPHYSTHASRFSTAKFQYVWLNAGDKVFVRDVTRFWVTYFGTHKYYNPDAISTQSVTSDSYTITDSGYYWILVERKAGLTTANVLKDGGLSLETANGYIKVANKYINIADINPPVKLGKDVLKMGINLTLTTTAPYAIVSAYAKRFGTPPAQALKVSKGDILYSHITTEKTSGMYLQLQGDDGTYTLRSWSFADYVVPKDGKLLILCQIKDDVPVSEYESIMLNAFSLSSHAISSSCSKSCVDEKINVTGNQKFSYLKEAVAHRGLEAVAPENTLPAFRAAAAAGFNWVECDVRFTSDAIPVICHDADISRTSDGSGYVHSYTLAQLREFDFGSWFGAEFTGTPIPTLENVLNTCAQLRLNLVIDFSNTGTPNRDRLQGIINLIKSTGMAGRVMFLSLDPVAIMALLYMEKDESYVAGVSLISGDSIPDIINAGGDNNTNIIKEYRRMGYDVSYSVYYPQLTPVFLTYCAENNIPVNVYTIGDTATLDSIGDASMIHFVTVSADILVQDYYKQKELDKACTEL